MIIYMKTIFSAFFMFLALAFTLQGFSQNVTAFPQKLVDFASSDIWKGNPSFAKHNDNIYILYTTLNNKGQICKYTISTGAVEWSGDLFDTVGEHDPSHNDSAISVDGDGYLHCWIGMHNDPLKYYRSVAPGDFKTFENRSVEMPNHIKTRASYPWSCTATNGDVFLIIRRSLSLDNEYQDLYHWDNIKKEWAMTTIAGKFGDSAYMSAIHADSNNNIHIATVWSDYHFHDNHFQRGTYLRYEVDTDQFFKADGTKVTDLPVQHDRFGSDLFYENHYPWGETEEIQTPRITTNANNEPIIVYPYTPDNGGIWSYKMAMWDGTKWTSKEVYTMGTRYGRPPLTADGNSIRIYSTDVSEKAVYVSYSNNNGATFNSKNTVEKSDYVFAKMAINSNLNEVSTDFLISRRHLFKIQYKESEKDTIGGLAIKTQEILLGDILSDKVKKGFEGTGSYRIICKNGYKSVVQMKSDPYLRQNTLAKSNTQIWNIIEQKDGYASVVNKYSGEAMYSKGTGNKIDVRAKKFENNDLFLWKIEPSGFGYYHLLNKENGLALVPGGHHGSTDVMSIMSSQNLRPSYNEFNWLIVQVDLEGEIIELSDSNGENLKEPNLKSTLQEMEVKGFKGRGFYAIRNNKNQSLAIKQGSINLQIEDFEGKINQLWYINVTSKGEIAIQSKMTNCVLKLSENNIVRALSSEEEDPYLWKLSKNNEVVYTATEKLFLNEKGIDKTIQIDSKNQKENEVWNLYPLNNNIPIPSAVAGGQFYGEYLVKNKKSEKYLRRELENFRASQHVFYGYSFHNGIWEIRHIGNDFYYLINKETGQLLSEQLTESKAYVKAFYNNDEFAWKITEVSNGFYKIENKKSGNALRIDSNKSGYHIDLTSFDKTDNMLWELIK